MNAMFRVIDASCPDCLSRTVYLKTLDHHPEDCLRHCTSCGKTWTPEKVT